MPVQVNGTILELEGDADTGHKILSVPSSVVGDAQDGDTVGVSVLTVSPLLGFVVVGVGTTMCAIEEVEGDQDSDSKWVVCPSELLNPSDGTVLPGATYDTAEGPVTLFQIVESLDTAGAPPTEAAAQ